MDKNKSDNQDKDNSYQDREKTKRNFFKYYNAWLWFLMILILALYIRIEFKLYDFDKKYGNLKNRLDSMSCSSKMIHTDTGNPEDDSRYIINQYFSNENKDVGNTTNYPVVRNVNQKSVSTSSKSERHIQQKKTCSKQTENKIDSINYK